MEQERREQDGTTAACATDTDARAEEFQKKYLYASAEILTTGQRFDPNVAEAIGTQQSSEMEPGTVLAEAQRGYLLDDSLLRPAKVIVAKND